MKTEKMMEQLFKKFMNTPEAEQLIKSEISEENRRRAELIKENSTLYDQVLKKVDERVKKEAQLKSEIERMEAAKYRILTEILAIKNEQRAMESKIEQNTAALRASADLAIDEAITFFRIARERLRHVQAEIIRTPTGRANARGEQEFTLRSTKDSLDGCEAYCRTAIEQLEGMKTKDAAVDLASIIELKDNLPDPKAWTEKIIVSDLSNDRLIALKGGI